MHSWTISELKESGFGGFVKIGELKNKYSEIPEERGIYLILWINPKVNFLEIGTGGHHKNKDPNVTIEILKSNWITNSIVVYIGQAGGIRNGNWSNSTLRKRLKQYIQFGEGKPVAHWGGRYIWQILNNQDLIVCWKDLPNKVEDPLEVESKLIGEFKNTFGLRPFANLRG